MIKECEVCGSKDIEYVYLDLCYRCNFCKTNTYKDSKKPTKRKKSFIYLRNVDIKIWMNKSKKRYVYLNGVALRQYKSTELIQMKEDYIDLNRLKDMYMGSKITYMDFIEVIRARFNDFNAVFYNEQQCKVDLNIREREEHINRLKNSGYESDWFLVVSCDLKNSSRLIDSNESNLEVVSNFLYNLNDGLVHIFDNAYYKQNMGDGFMALYKSDDLEKVKKSIKGIYELSNNLDKSLDDDLRGSIDKVSIGVAVDYSKVIIIYSQGDVLTGHAINKASKLCKSHLRSIDEGLCLTTPRLRELIPNLEFTNTIKNKNQMDTLVLSQKDLDSLTFA